MLYAAPHRYFLGLGWLQLHHYGYLAGILYQVVNFHAFCFFLGAPVAASLSRPGYGSGLCQFLYHFDIAVFYRIIECSLMVETYFVHIYVTRQEIVNYAIVIVHCRTKKRRSTFVVTLVKEIIISAYKFFNSLAIAFFYGFEEGIRARFFIGVGVLPKCLVDIGFVFDPKISGLLQSID